MYVEVVGSYTLDLVTWTCPKCGNTNEQQGVNLYETTCQECGFDIESLDLQDTTTEEETIYIEKN